MVVAMGGVIVGLRDLGFSGSDVLEASCSATALEFSGGGSPVITGGGSSRPSFAFRDSWRAKSDACHHSKNLSANIDVGNRIFSDVASRGPMTWVMIRLLNSELP